MPRRRRSKGPGPTRPLEQVVEDHGDCSDDLGRREEASDLDPIADLATVARMNNELRLAIERDITLAHGWGTSKVKPEG